MTHFTINNRKVSPYTINKSNACILRLINKRENFTPEIKKNTPEIKKTAVSNKLMIQFLVPFIRFSSIIFWNDFYTFGCIIVVAFSNMSKIATPIFRISINVLPAIRKISPIMISNLLKSFLGSLKKNQHLFVFIEHQILSSSESFLCVL